MIPMPVLSVSLQKREAFCQLLQLMKMRHSKQDEPDVISVFVGTWNMGNPGDGALLPGRAEDPGVSVKINYRPNPR